MMMKSLPLAAVALLTGMVQAPPALAATLRPMTTLDSGVVRLSDLFDGAGAEAGRVLGPGPAPGQRIVVRARQLAAIARQFDVDWRPNSPGDRIVLTRPGRLLGRDRVVAALRRALVAAGADTDADIELPGFTPPLVPEDGEPQLAVEQLDYRDGARRFSARLLLSAPDMAPERLRVAGRLRAMVSLPVATRALAAGHVIAPGDLHIARVPASRADDTMLHDPARAAGMVLRRAATAGQPLERADLTLPEAVARGALVAMELQAPGLVVTAQGEALDGGPTGARIRVRNTASRAVLEAVITGPGRVRIAPGSAPLASAGHGGSGGGGGGYYANFAANGGGR